jgi:transposase-like protein
MEQFSNEGRARRRAYSKAFKAQLVAACAQPGASVGGVALSHGLHANMVHRWIREAQTVRASPRTRTEAEPSFISLPLTAVVARSCDEQALAALPPPPPSPPPTSPVQVRLQRGELVVSLQCPLSQCGALLREVLR